MKACRIRRCAVSAVPLRQRIAQASGSSDEARARPASTSGVACELFQEEAFRAALAEFQRAYDIAPDFRLLYNIGQTKLELHDYLGAAQSYERYLSTGYLDISPERRAEVEAGTDRTARAHGEREDRRSIASGAEVFIDDVKVGTSPIAAVVLINVGGHRVTARTSYGSTDTGDDRRGRWRRGQRARSSWRRRRRSRARRAQEPWNTAERTAVATWSAAGALAVGALVTGLMANGRAGRARQAARDARRQPLVDLEQARQRPGPRGHHRRPDRHRQSPQPSLPRSPGSSVTKRWKLQEQRRLEVSPSLHWTAGPSSLGVSGRF